MTFLGIYMQFFIAKHEIEKGTQLSKVFYCKQKWSQGKSYVFASIYSFNQIF